MKNNTMAWRNVLRNKRRSLLAASAIAIAAMSILLLFSILAGLSAEMRDNLRRYYFGEIRVRHTEFEKNANLNPLHLSIENASAVLEDLGETEGFASAGGRIRFPTAVFRNDEELGLLMTGLQFSEDPFNIQDFLIEGRIPEGREVILGKKAAEELGVTVGDKFTAVTMTLRRASNGMTFEVVGIAALPLNDLNHGAYIPLSTAQRFTKMGDRVVDILLHTENGVSTREGAEAASSVLAAFQREGINADAAVESWREIPSAYMFIALAQISYYIIGMIFYLLASTVIINTIMMIIFERTKEIGTLASMGMEGKNIVRMFFMESLFISAIGSVIGVVAGSILTLVLEQTGIDFTDALGGIDFQISGIMYPKLTIYNVVIALLTGIFVASGISLLPSRRAAKIKPVEAMRSI
ncbi:MAG: ABC transporter permease [Salinispira sp.]